MQYSTEAQRLAKVAYLKYGQTTDFKNYQGNPMPEFDDLGDQIQAAWCEAAVAVAREVVDTISDEQSTNYAKHMNLENNPAPQISQVQQF